MLGEVSKSISSRPPQFLVDLFKSGSASENDLKDLVTWLTDINSPVENGKAVRTLLESLPETMASKATIDHRLTVIRKLEKLLSNKSAYVRCSVAEALIKLGIRDKAIPELKRLLHHDEPEYDVNFFPTPATAIRDLGREALGEQVKDIINELIYFLQWKDPNSFPSAAETLGSLGAVEAIPELEKFLDNDSVNLYAAQALIALGVKEKAVPALEKNLDSKYTTYSSIRAAKVLLDLGITDKAIPVLEKLLNGKDILYAIWAAEALGKSGKTISVLERFLNSSDYDYIRYSLEALSKIDAKESASVIIPLLDHEDYSIVASAAQALGKLGIHEAAAKLTKLLLHEKPYVVKSAINALGLLNAKEFIPVLELFLKHASADIAIAAAMAIGNLGSREKAIPILEDFLNDTSPDIVISAARVLERLKAKESIPKLEEQLNPDNKAVRVIVEAIANILS